MTQYNIDNTILIGKPCRVFDAAGMEVLHCTFCDTDTGEVERVAFDGHYFVLNETRDGAARFRENRPSPLRIEWCQPVPEGE